MLLTENIFSNEPEDKYSSLVNHQRRKAIGQFFTPFPIAQFMTKWVTASNVVKTILDPGVGIGVFFRAAISLKPDCSYNFIGFDIDDAVVQYAREVFKALPDVKVTLENKDYLLSDWGNKYDGIICNPPYLKFHDYGNKEQILSEFETRFQMKLTGFTNIYTLFFLKSINQLSNSGRAAFIVPSEFLNANYGVRVKEYLIKSGMLRYVIVIDFETNVFSEAITTSSILLFANDKNKRSVEFKNVKSLEELMALESCIESYTPDESNRLSAKSILLDPAKKWRAYYSDVNGDKYGNLVCLSNFAKVMRGIATGDNAYFRFSMSKARKYGISDKYLLPCITKANQIENHFFTRADFERLKKEDEPVFLLNAVDIADKNLLTYIRLGEEKEVSKRYLTRHRNPWYKIENRPSSQILIAVFSRGGLKFVKNEAGVHNLTCFHCIYLAPLYTAKTDLLMAYLVTNVAQQIIYDEKREYEDGLDKFEPNDLNIAKIVNLDVIDEIMESKILELYHMYRQADISKENAKEIKDELDKTFRRLLRR